MDGYTTLVSSAPRPSTNAAQCPMESRAAPLSIYRSKNQKASKRKKPLRIWL